MRVRSNTLKQAKHVLQIGWKQLNFAALIRCLWQIHMFAGQKGSKPLHTHSKILEKHTKTSHWTIREKKHRMEHNHKYASKDVFRITLPWNLHNTCMFLGQCMFSFIPWCRGQVRHVQPDIDREALRRHRWETLEQLGFVTCCNMLYHMYHMLSYQFISIWRVTLYHNKPLHLIATKQWWVIMNHSTSLSIDGIFDCDLISINQADYDGQCKLVRCWFLVFLRFGPRNITIPLTEWAGQTSAPFVA